MYMGVDCLHLAKPLGSQKAHRSHILNSIDSIGCLIDASDSNSLTVTVCSTLHTQGSLPSSQCALKGSLPIKPSLAVLIPYAICRKRPRQEFHQLLPTTPQPVQSSPASVSSAKAERRRFMSGKASDVHRAAAPQEQPQKKRRLSSQSQGSGLSREDFLNMQREVQTFGEYLPLLLFFCCTQYVPVISLRLGLCAVATRWMH